VLSDPLHYAGGESIPPRSFSVGCMRDMASLKARRNIGETKGLGVSAFPDAARHHGGNGREVRDPYSGDGRANIDLRSVMVFLLGSRGTCPSTWCRKGQRRMRR
jgi:hypothetical protein